MISSRFPVAIEGDVTYVDADLLVTAPVRAELEALCARPEAGIVAHRAKELAHGLRVDLRSLAHDTALMAYLLDPAAGKYALEDLAPRYLSVELTSPDRTEGTLDLDGDAGVEDTQRRASIVPRLADALEEALQARELVDLYERIELPLVRVLARMEDAGVRIDIDFLNQLGKELNDECRRLEAEIHSQAGEQFNVNSTPQLRRILFEKLGLTPVKKTKTGPSTDADSLQKLAEEHPVVETLLRYREVEKLRSTYADALAAPRRRRRSHPRDLQPARDHNGPHLVGVAESPERAGPHRRWPGAPAGVHRRRGMRSPHRRLLADRAAGAGASGRRPGSHRRVRTRRRRAHHDGGEGVRRRRVEGRRVPTPVREGRQLRARLRHGGVRPRAAARHPDGSRGGDSRRVLRRVPECRGLHARDDPRREVRRGTPRRSSVAAASSRSSPRTTSGSARWASGWLRTRRCRARRPTSSSWR